MKNSDNVRKNENCSEKNNEESVEFIKSVQYEKESKLTHEYEKESKSTQSEHTGKDGSVMKNLKGETDGEWERMENQSRKHEKKREKKEGWDFLSDLFSSEEEILIFWESLKNTEIYDGENTFFVAFPGIRSLYGPDFKNAVVFVNGRRFEGDVECHLKSSFWFSHKHHIDHNYSNVLFHVVLFNDADLPSFTIDISKIRKINEKNVFLCSNRAGEIYEKEKREILSHMGRLRLRGKVERMKKRLDELGGNLNQLLYEFTAEALGYEKFRNFMLLFSRKFELGFILSLKDSDFEEIVNREIENFLNSSEISGGIYPTSRGFHFPSHPENSPRKRLFVLREIFKKNLMNSIFDLFERKARYTDWKKEIKVKGLGEGRLRTIIVNVFSPFILVSQFSKDEDEVINYFSSFPPEEENRIIRRAKKLLKIERYNMIEAQGMIELFRLKCSKFLCYACPLR